MTGDRFLKDSEKYYKFKYQLKICTNIHKIILKKMQTLNLELMALDIVEDERSFSYLGRGMIKDKKDDTRYFGFDLGVLIHAKISIKTLKECFSFFDQLFTEVTDEEQEKRS